MLFSNPSDMPTRNKPDKQPNSSRRLNAGFASSSIPQRCNHHSASGTLLAITCDIHPRCQKRELQTFPPFAVLSFSGLHARVLQSRSATNLTVDISFYFWRNFSIWARERAYPFSINFKYVYIHMLDIKYTPIHIVRYHTHGVYVLGLQCPSLGS